MLGIMIDCSRNAVMNVETVKDFTCQMAKMGYDTLMLYTEDTYEVDGEPYFGYLRGRYTKDELKQLDAHCQSLGIELIPCVQTLAHLNAIFKWIDEYETVRDCDDVLLLEEERTEQLIEHIFATLRQCVSTDKIHIGMDEAYRVGLGKYLDKHGYAPRFDLINRHLHKVCRIAEKYGFKPMIWSDMFCKLALNSSNYYAGGDLSAIREKADLPENTSLVYWDYYSTDPKRYETMIDVNRAFDRPVLFAGGAWTWKGFAPDNTLSLDVTETALRVCREKGLKDLFITMWGDDGGECSRYALLPALVYAAQAAKGNFDRNSAREKFTELFGADWDDYMLADQLDRPGGEHRYNPSKYLLYNDPFLGIKDPICTEADNAYYAALTEKLAAVPQNGVHTAFFETLRALSSVLSVKSNLGNKTRGVYLSGDRQAIYDLCDTDYAQAIIRVKKLHQALQAQWMAENKPNGFEIQDIRLGGLIQRLESCRKRLLAYADGEIEAIAELEETRIDQDPGIGKAWSRIVSPGVISHG